MLFRKTQKTVIKKIYRGKDDTCKSDALYRVITYWFLFIPIYSKQQFIS